MRDLHAPCNLLLAVSLEQRIIALRVCKKAPILQLHFTVFEEIVENWKDIALRWIMCPVESRERIVF